MSELSRVDEEIAFLIGETPAECAAFLPLSGMSQDCQGWRAAHIASWSVPVACCVKCRRHEYACAGLAGRHTTHRTCWPEAWDGEDT